MQNPKERGTWCPKYRRPILTAAVAQRLDELVGGQVKALQGDVIALEIQPDHEQLYAGFRPNLAVPKIMHHLKGYTSHELCQEFDWLNRRRPSLWTRSYDVGSAGNVSAETIRRYIEAQAGQ